MKHSYVIEIIGAACFILGWLAHTPPKVPAPTAAVRSDNAPPADIQMMESRYGWCTEDRGHTWWPARVSDEKGIQCYDEDKGK